MRGVNNVKSSSEQRFLLTPMGQNTITKVIPALNDLLPDNLKLPHATSHCGRVTAASVSVNAGIDPEIVAKTAKR